MATEHPEVAIAVTGTEKTPFITTDLPTPEASPTFAHKDAPAVHLIDIPNLSDHDHDHDHDHDTPAPPYSNTPAQDAAPVEAPVDPLASDLLHARSQHMARLASMYAEMELVAREHDAHLSALYQAEIVTLQAQIDAGVAEQKALKQRLVEVTEHKKMEINALRAEMQAAKAAFDEELETRRREAQALLEAMLAEERSRSEEALVGERERSKEELEALKKAEEERVNTLLKEMTHEADERIRAVQSEMMIEMEGKMKALSEEMERMKRDFASEREHNARAMKVLAEKEAEARRRAESSERHKQPLQAWAVARLWGVGQGRSR